MDLGDDRIIQLVRNNLAQLATELDHPGWRVKLAGIDSALHELALRNDASTRRDHHRRGIALAHEGLALTAHAATITSVLPATDDDTDTARASLMDCLRALIAALGSRPDAEGRAFLDRVCAWELEMPLRRARRADALTAVAAVDRFTREAVESYWRQRFPQRADLRVTRLQNLAGGFSKRTVLVTFADATGEDEMVIRANQPACNIRTDGADVRNEFGVLAAAFAAGLPIPEPLWLECDDAPFGASFHVSRKAAGQVIGSGHTSQLFQAVTPAIRTELARTMAQLHRVPADADNVALAATHLARWMPHRDLHRTAVASVEYWMAEVRAHAIAPTPLMQRLHDWLIAHAPPPLPYTPVLMHGDYGLHNILFEGERISAVLDWEIAKIGDPAEEFIPLFLSLSTEFDAALVAEYEAAGGQPVSRFRVSWYRLLILLRIVIFEAAAARNLAQSDAADIALFNWFTVTTPLMVGNVNALMARAEAERRAEYGDA